MSTNERLDQQELPVPKPGDIVYVDTEGYVWHGMDDFHGGKATVTRVWMEHMGRQQVPWIEIAERPRSRYKWAALARKQAELAAEFGATWSHADPDYSPEFNNNDEGWVPIDEPIEQHCDNRTPDNEAS
jgi:hypothetical protein